MESVCPPLPFSPKILSNQVAHLLASRFVLLKSHPQRVSLLSPYPLSASLLKRSIVILGETGGKIFFLFDLQVFESKASLLCNLGKSLCRCLQHPSFLENVLEGRRRLGDWVSPSTDFLSEACALLRSRNDKSFLVWVDPAENVV
jgi:hypothetical protein